MSYLGSSPGGLAEVVSYYFPLVIFGWKYLHMGLLHLTAEAFLLPHCLSQQKVSGAKTSCLSISVILSHSTSVGLWFPLACQYTAPFIYILFIVQLNFIFLNEKSFLSHPLGDLGVMYALPLHLWLVGKLVVNFLLVIVELFRYLLWLRRYKRNLSKSAFFEGVGPLSANISGGSGQFPGTPIAVERSSWSTFY